MAEIFGTAPDGADVLRATISGGGARARILTWGALLQEYRLDGLPQSLVLGAPEFDAYPAAMGYFGCIVGRVANRISGGRAVLDGKVLELERNELGRTTLHGGSDGTSARSWQIVAQDENAVTLALRLPDGQGGFPGNIDFRARYSLDDRGALWLEITAETDAPTFCNPAHHAYWNLDGTADTSRHVMAIAADRYLPVDDHLIPLGDPAPVGGTRWDFRTPRAITAPYEPVLDHNFCLNGEGMRPACTLQSGDVRLEISTTAPGLQVFDGTGMDTSPFAGLAGHPYGSRGGVAIEPQLWPDAPNQPGYPSVELRPGETFRQVSCFHASHNR